MTKHTALIADFGGVLTSSVMDSFGKWCEEHRVEFNELISALTGSPEGILGSPLHLIEVGEIDEAEFSKRLSAVLDKPERPVPIEDLKGSLFSEVRPDPVMVDVIARLRREGVATCLLSNSWGTGSDYPHEVLSELFDEMIFSGEVGLRKPDPEIYLMAASKIDKDPSGCVFIDDLKVNVKAAEALGMAGIHHVSTEKSVGELKGLFPRALSEMS